MSKFDLSLFDALRIVEGTPKSLAVDAEELKTLGTKSPETIKAVAEVKDVFGLDARVRR